MSVEVLCTCLCKKRVAYLNITEICFAYLVCADRDPYWGALLIMMIGVTYQLCYKENRGSFLLLQLDFVSCINKEKTTLRPSSYIVKRGTQLSTSMGGASQVTRGA